MLQKLSNTRFGVHQSPKKVLITNSQALVA